MATPFKKLAFFSKKTPKSAKVARAVLNFLLLNQKKGRFSELLVEDTTAYYLKYAGKRASAREIRKADCFIIVGGDGTFLSLELQYPGTPKLGINSGIVGFLSNLDEKNCLDGLDLFLEGKYWMEERSKLEATYNNKKSMALNDILIHAKASARVISMDITTKHFTKKVAGDGVLFSTPTGSTAYSLSAGGPIIHWKVDCVLLTPVCPVNILKRPMVLPTATKFEVILTSERPAMISIDGRLEEQVRKVTIRTSKKKARLVKVFPEDLWKHVENKLMYY